MSRPGRTSCRDQAPPRRKCAKLHIFGVAARWPASCPPGEPGAVRWSWSHSRRSGLRTIGAPASVPTASLGCAWSAGNRAAREGLSVGPECEDPWGGSFTTTTTSLTECTRTVRRARPDRMRSPALAFGGWPGWLLPPGGLPGPGCNFRARHRPVVCPLTRVQPGSMICIDPSNWPGGVSAPQAMAPPEGTGDAVVVYYTQTRSRQGRVFCLHRSPRPSRGGGAPPDGGAMVPSGMALRRNHNSTYLEVDHMALIDLNNLGGRQYPEERDHSGSSRRSGTTAAPAGGAGPQRLQPPDRVPVPRPPAEAAAAF